MTLGVERRNTTWACGGGMWWDGRVDHSRMAHDICIAPTKICVIPRLEDPRTSLAASVVRYRRDSELRVQLLSRSHTWVGHIPVRTRRRCSLLSGLLWCQSFPTRVENCWLYSCGKTHIYTLRGHDWCSYRYCSAIALAQFMRIVAPAFLPSLSSLHFIFHIIILLRDDCQNHSKVPRYRRRQPLPPRRRSSTTSHRVATVPSVV